MRYIPVLAGLGISACLLVAEVSTVEEIVCKVNSDIITRSDLEREKELLIAQLRATQNLTGSRLQEAVAAQAPDILRDKIDSLLLVQRGKDLGFKVDKDVTKRMADLQRSTNIADPEKFQQLVREQTGKSYEDYKADMKNNILAQTVIQEEVSRKILFKTEELKAYYDMHQSDFQRDERVFLREIVVAFKDKNDPIAVSAAEKKAKDLADRARKGERFAELAQANSDSSSAQNGGELPPYTKDVLKPELQALIWDKDRGYVTDPMRLPDDPRSMEGGFMILRVDSHPKAGLADFEEVQNTIQEYLARSRQGPAMRAYLTKLRQDAFLEIKPGFEDTGAAPEKDTSWSQPIQITPKTTTKEEVLEKGTHKHFLGIPLPGTVTHEGTSSSR